MTSAHVSVLQCYTVAHAGRVFTRADYADRVLSPRDFVCGVAVFDRMPSGVFAFVVESKPHPASLSRVFEVPGEAGEITVQLTRGAVLEGVVTDENANPLADATVHTAPHPSMFEPLGFGASPLVLGTRASVRTDREGRYRIEGIAHGKYRVFATHRDHCGVRRDVSVTEDKIIAVDAFAIPRGCVVEGVATLDGAAVAGIRISLEPGDNGVVEAEVEQVPAGMHENQRAVWSGSDTVTDSTGAFRFTSAVPPGKWHIYAIAPDADLHSVLLQMNATKSAFVVGSSDANPTRNIHLSSKR
ncbi:MAG TPA: carboxypeptidase-like regulatory domain-containing protein [Planctomycetota bacterium]|nr:carboxypeptidase-like regulatory domain-containing protein [Planctomycetota bacterium]